MTRFKFRLATLLKLRETERDERRGEYMEALRAVDVVRSQQASLESELEALRAARRVQTGVLNVDLMIQSSQHELLLRAQVDLLDKQSADIQAEAERRRAKLLEADRAVKVLEKLRDRQSQRFTEELWRQEGQALDEVSQSQASQRSMET
ncbi:MAG: flagellar export protein FliJ [Pirellulales bacterium]|nr:flagellar export protein FliJ [Pirellulales bacterium]